MQGNIQFIDHIKIRRKKLVEQMHLTAAKIAVKYGVSGLKMREYTYDQIKEFWTFNDNYPTSASLALNTNTATVKWYIYKKLKTTDEIWNSDFINGLATHGTLSFSKRKYPTLNWFWNKGIGEICQTSPFGGRVTLSGGKAGKWVQVPAFYIKHSKDTLSFVAGLMAGAKAWKHNGLCYARFRGSMKKLIEDLKIPIEYFSPSNKYFLISPIWPALFTLKMPEVARIKWLNIKNPCNADIYAPILWRTYINKRIRTKGIPYLKSERTISYDFNCEEGAMKRIEKLRVEKGLTELDNRVIEMVRMWSKQNEKSNAESSNM